MASSSVRSRVRFSMKKALTGLASTSEPELATWPPCQPLLTCLDDRPVVLEHLLRAWTTWLCGVHWQGAGTFPVTTACGGDPRRTHPTCPTLPPAPAWRLATLRSVSYKHLTLPTIYS